MTKVILDNRIRAQLHDLKETVPLVDDGGQFLGVFMRCAWFSD